MQMQDACEMAYKNGYIQGIKDASEVLNVEEATLRVGYWKWTADGNRVCSHCGIMEPDCMPGACVIWPEEKRYCFKCGTRLIYPERQ